MKSGLRMWKRQIVLGMMLFTGGFVLAEEETSGRLPGNGKDTLSFFESRCPQRFTLSTDNDRFSRHFIHRLGVEARSGYVFPTNPFLKGENKGWEPIKTFLSAHLKYSFQFHPNTCADRIYGGAYQGIGLGYYAFGNKEELGNPIAFYLFQGARIARLAPRLSLNYEWNFGLSGGWKPYDPDHNFNNKAIGSKLNAYINMNFYLNWMLSRYFDLTTGVTLTHFSNGNTRIPNAGLNMVDAKIGLAYHFNRKINFLSRSSYSLLKQKFPRHMSYDLVLFGSWRRKGVTFNEEQIVSPAAYTVIGVNFAPMYNVGYKLRLGISVDGVYDGSANVYMKGYTGGTVQDFFKPSLNKQLSLGFSGRVEYVMPFFTVGIGLGANVLHGGGDLDVFYQVLALKINMTRHSFLHIGYNLQDFHTPSFLMLGIGFRFNNKYPALQ